MDDINLSYNNITKEFSIICTLWIDQQGVFSPGCCLTKNYIQPRYYIITPKLLILF